MPCEVDEAKSKREASRRWLSSVSQAVAAMHRIKGELDCFESEAGLKGTDYSAVRVSTSPTQDGVHNLLMRKESLVARYQAAQVEYMELFDQAKTAIDSLDDERYRSVLSYRYLQGMSYNEVADRIGHEYRYTLRLAYDALERVWDFVPLYAK